MARRALNDAVVVVTGASSGIGRATAWRLAAEGAAVVAVARREAPLRVLAGQIEREGGRALAVAADVRDADALRAVADRAVSELGGLDVWVSNAGVTAFGAFSDVPPELFRGVIETNLFGMVHGARAALPHLRERGGVLINQCSIVGEIPAPCQTSYVASKAAIRGFSASLREELRGTDVHVCTILPGPFDTPIWQHAANRTGRRVKALQPTGDPWDVAEAIVRTARRPRREVVVGRGAATLVRQHRLLPALTERVVAKQVLRDGFEEAPAPPTDGNVPAPMEAYTGVDGGWRDGRVRRLGRRVAVGAALALAGGAAATRVARARR